VINSYSSVPDYCGTLAHEGISSKREREREREREQLRGHQERKSFSPESKVLSVFELRSIRSK